MALPQHPAWKALYEYVISNPDPFEGVEPQKLDPERLAFLEKALDASVIDENEHVKKLLDVLTRDITEEQQLDALDAILMSVERLDIANNLAKYTPDGWTPLLHLLRSGTPAVRQSAAQVLSTAVQNNPTSQADATSRNIIPAAVSCLTCDSADARVRSAGMSIISAMTRNNEPLQTELITTGRLQECITVALAGTVATFAEPDTRRLVTRTLFLVSMLSRQLAGNERAQLFSDDLVAAVNAVAGAVVDNMTQRLPILDGQAVDMTEKALQAAATLPKAGRADVKAKAMTLKRELDRIKSGLDEDEAANVTELVGLMNGL